MPDASKVCASFVDLALVAQLAQLVHQVDTTKPGTNDKDVRLQLLRIVLVLWRGILIGRTNVCPEVNHYVCR